MRPSRLVALVDGGKPARAAWKSLRKQVDADLERHLRREGRWPAIQQLLGDAVDREPSAETDAYLLAAGDLLRKLAKTTDRPMARAGCRGIAAAIAIRLGNADAARKPMRQSIDTLQNAITADMRVLGAAGRHAHYHDLQYRRRYLGNEVMALRRFLREEIEALDASTAPPVPSVHPKAVARRPRVRGGRAKVPSWDEILFGVRLVDSYEGAGQAAVGE